jgi:hypothetical protein
MVVLLLIELRLNGRMKSAIHYVVKRFDTLLIFILQVFGAFC